MTNEFPVLTSDDVILGLTTTGLVKVWTLQGNESKATEPHYEHESKQIRCLNALCMSCCGGNQRTVVIVCAKYWQVCIYGPLFFNHMYMK